MNNKQDPKKDDSDEDKDVNKGEASPPAYADDYSKVEFKSGAKPQPSPYTRLYHVSINIIWFTKSFFAFIETSGEAEDCEAWFHWEKV